MSQIIDRVNGVVSFLEENCHPPLTVYAETALPALGMGLMMLVVPSPDEILEEFIQPAGLRSFGRWGRRTEQITEARRARSLGQRATDIIPDIDELIAHRIPGYRRIAYRPISNGVRHLWRIYDTIEQASYRWLIFDAVTVTAYAWAENLRESEPCSANRAGGFLSDPDRQGTNQTFGTWNDLPPGDNYTQWGAVEWLGGGRFRSTSGPLTVIASASLQAYDGVDYFGLRVLDATDEREADRDLSTEVTRPEIREYTRMTAATVPERHIAITQYSWDGPYKPRQWGGYLYNITHTVLAGPLPRPNLTGQPRNPWPDYSICDPWDPIAEPPPTTLELPDALR